MNTKQIGTNFEKEVVDLYRLMGFDILHNLDIDGQQIDILASINISGSGVFKQIIECKYKSGNDSVGNDDVQSIAGAFIVSKARHQVAGCVLVTNTSFTPKAREVATATGIVLKTKDQLVSELIDFRHYKAIAVEHFHLAFGNPGQSWYIQTQIKTRDKQLESLDNYVDRWLLSDNKHPLVLRGGYGTGKSSFCLYYTAKLISVNSGITPVIIQLRDIQKAIKMESLIRDFLDEECQVQNPRTEIFRRMYEEGKVLIFLDGFDEMSAKVDATVLEANLVEIEKYARLGNVILTCRPEYFITAAEEKNAWLPKGNLLTDRVSLYEPVEIEEWSESQVIAYVTNRLTAENGEDRIEQCLTCIKNLPELYDLSSRAVHLELIVKMLPLMIEKNIPISRPNLYNTYIQAELVREVVKNRRLRLITDEERFNLMKEVAVAAYELNEAINFQSTYKVIEEKLNTPKSELEAVTRDFLNRSFLLRNGDNYSFAHKSIGEYLVSLKIAEQIRQGNLALIEKKFSRALASMTIEMLGGLEQYDEIVSLLKLDIPPNKFDRAACYRATFMMDGLHGFLRKMTYTQHAMLIHDVMNQLVSSLHLLMNVGGFDDTAEASKYFALWETFNSRMDLLKNYSTDGISRISTYVQHPEKLSVKRILEACIIGYADYRAAIFGEDEIVYADKISVQRIFENLVSNAVRAIGKEGKLDIIISNSTLGIVNIEFKNNGPAIPPEDINKIFQEGFTTRTEKPHLHGLGLYIVKSLLHEIGGKITVTSLKEETCFTVQLERYT